MILTKNFFSKYDLLDIPKSKPIVETKWGKEKSDIIGVRKKLLRKSFCDNVITDFNYEKFIKKLIENFRITMNLGQNIHAKHREIFESY